MPSIAWDVQHENLKTGTSKHQVVPEMLMLDFLGQAQVGVVLAEVAINLRHLCQLGLGPRATKLTRLKCWFPMG